MIDLQNIMQDCLFRDIKNNIKLKYRLYLPKITKNAPLVLFMHGAGERGNTNTEHIINRDGTSTFLIKLIQGNYGAVIIAPQCPLDKQWVGKSPKIWSDGYYSLDTEKETDCLKAVINLLEYIQNKYKTNIHRIYISGLSMGGFATYDIIMRHKNIFAAAVPICGGCDTTKASEIDLPLYIAHGTNDESVPYTISEKMVENLKKYNKEYIFKSYKTTHNCWSQAYSDDNLYTWLFSKIK